MSPVCEDKTETWTRDEVIETVKAAAQHRLGITLEQLVSDVKTDKIDLCEFAEVVALLNMLGEDDPIFRNSCH